MGRGKSSIEIVLRFEGEVTYGTAAKLNVKDLAVDLGREASIALARFDPKGWQYRVLRARKHGPKQTGVSRTVPDRDWVEQVLAAEKMGDIRVRKRPGKHDTIWCDTWSTRRGAILIHSQDMDASPSGAGAVKAKHLKDDAKRQAFADRVATHFVAPIRWAILHGIVHRRRYLDKTKDWATCGDPKFFNEFIALVRKHVPGACTSDALTIEHIGNIGAQAEEGRP